MLSFAGEREVSFFGFGGGAKERKGMKHIFLIASGAIRREKRLWAATLPGKREMDAANMSPCHMQSEVRRHERSGDAIQPHYL